MVKLDICYVLTNAGTGSVEMATTNDSEAWAFYRDSRNIVIQVFINKNRVATIPPREEEQS